MEIINNSKTNYNFLFVDSSISEKNLVDFISTNKNYRVISFDFESADILKKCNIKFEHSETFLNNFLIEFLVLITFDQFNLNLYS